MFQRHPRQYNHTEGKQLGGAWQEAHGDGPTDPCQRSARAQACPPILLSPISCPGIGRSAPASHCLPTFSISHNERIAFSLPPSSMPIRKTSMSGDRSLGSHTLNYRHGDGFERMTERVPTFRGQGAPAQQATQYFTRHSPVVIQRCERHRHCIPLGGPGRATPISPGASAIRAGNFAGIRRRIVPLEEHRR